MKNTTPFSQLIKFLQETPSLLLLLFVFLFIIPRSLSYDNAWLQPEEAFLKSIVLETGPDLNFKDLKHGLSSIDFEYESRCTRPLSSYFEILDTKFRCWLWKYFLPHPSLSLTWVFSFILTPLLLYKLLKNLSISRNTAMALVSFYLVTPGVLSYEVMLFRPGKAMSSFSIILCLYLASHLQKKFIDKKRPVPLRSFISLWLLTWFSFFWDETVWLLFPTVFVLFPQIIKRKLYLCLWLLLPVFALLGYFVIIPFLTLWSGNGLTLLNNSHNFTCAFRVLSHCLIPLKHLFQNASNLIFDTMGLIIPSPGAPWLIKITLFLSLLSWVVLISYLIRIKKGEIPLLSLLAAVIFFFNYSMSVIQLYIWGPYWYGTYWSVFFTLYLARIVEKAYIPKLVFTGCIFIILVNLSNCFIATNSIYKKYHYYPYTPTVMGSYFSNKMTRFDPSSNPPYSGKTIKQEIVSYWTRVRDNRPLTSFSLPKELTWLTLELEPAKHYAVSGQGTVNKADFDKEFGGRGKEIYTWLWGNDYMLRYDDQNFILRGDLDANKEALINKFPDISGRILEMLHRSLSRNPLYAYFSLP